MPRRLHGHLLVYRHKMSELSWDLEWLLLVRPKTSSLVCAHGYVVVLRVTFPLSLLNCYPEGSLLACPFLSTRHHVIIRLISPVTPSRSWLMAAWNTFLAEDSSDLAADNHNQFTSSFERILAVGSQCATPLTAEYRCHVGLFVKWQDLCMIVINGGCSSQRARIFVMAA